MPERRSPSTKKRSTGTAVERNGQEADPFDVGPETTWGFVDLSALARGESVERPPTIGRRDDGIHLIYESKVHAINSESEDGKTWLALEICRQQMELGHHVVFIDFEDSEAGIFGRLENLGVGPDVIVEQFHYVRPDESLEGEAAAQHFERELASVDEITLVVIDGVTEAYQLHGLNIDSNADAAKFMDLLPRRLTRAGIAVLALDHFKKDPRNRRYAIGAQHKLSGADGAVYSLKVTRRFSRGNSGSAILTVSKDRPGWVRPHAATEDMIARINFAAGEENALRVEICALSSGSKVSIVASAPDDEKVANAKKIAEKLLRKRRSRQRDDGWYGSGRAVIAAIRKEDPEVPYKACRSALNALVGEGKVEQGERGRRSAVPHRWHVD